MEPNDHIASLLRKHINKTLSLEEKKELLLLAEDDGLREQWITALAELGASDLNVNLTDDLPDDNRWQLMFDEVLNRKHSSGKLMNFAQKQWIRYAAMVLIVAGVGAYFMVHKTTVPQKTIAKELQVHSPAIEPAGNKAVLTLADGTDIVLDNADNGDLAKQGDVKIMKINAGSLSYASTGKRTKDMMYNKITTPRGGLFHVVLPDGSNAWLNAESYIRFPVDFSAKERRIEVGGEVYLEINKETKRPFLVKTPSSEIQVLGTSFNVNSYDEEVFNTTTLIEGSIRVLNGTKESVITPGQRLRIDKKGTELLDKQVLTEEVIAWKNGIFNFNNADLATVLRELARWYDIEVYYEKAVPANEVIFGKMERSLKLSQVLEGLGDLGVHFRIEGKKLIVLP